MAQPPTLNQLYHAKESLHGFYRIRGEKRARRALAKMCDALALSDVPELLRLRKTLTRWREEILHSTREPQVSMLSRSVPEGHERSAKHVAAITGSTA